MLENQDLYLEVKHTRTNKTQWLFLCSKIKERTLLVRMKMYGPKDGPRGSYNTVSSVWPVEGWKPVVLCKVSAGKTSYQYLSETGVDKAWEIVSSLLVGRDRDHKHILFPHHDRSCITNINRKAETEEEKRGKDAVSSIVKKYFDHWNAVIISPGSEIDNKLQEAYLSRREKPVKKETINEQTSPG